MFVRVREREGGGREGGGGALLVWCGAKRSLEFGWNPNLGRARSKKGNGKILRRIQELSAQILCLLFPKKCGKKGMACRHDTSGFLCEVNQLGVSHFLCSIPGSAARRRSGGTIMYEQ